MKIGLSMLCEQPNRRTGLTSLFNAFLRESVALADEVEFTVFCADDQGFDVAHPRVKRVGGYSANDQLMRRLFAEHFLLGGDARRRGLDVLMTTGLVPVWNAVAPVMHLLTLHHLSQTNRMSWSRSAYRSWASRRGLRRAQLVITNTRFACRQILQVDPSAAPKVLQSYEGIDHGDFHPVRDDPADAAVLARHGLQDGYFFWCSNFYPYKQAELLMEAWCDLPATIRAAHPLVMVGGGAWGGSKDRAIEIARERGALGDVKMLGWVEDAEVPVLFRHAAVFVHPSREETFGRSVLEAMASGVPCVVQDIPVMPEVTGGNALSIDYAKRDVATAALRRALEDQIWRGDVIPAALAHAANFSFRRLAGERLVALYRMLGRPAPDGLREFTPVYASDFS